MIAPMSEHGSPLPPGRGLLLSRFFEDVYLPLQMRQAHPATLRLYREAIGWFRKALQRAPRLSDLERGTLAALYEAMAKVGLSLARIRDVRKRLCALWRYAAACGLAAPLDPAPLPDTKQVADPRDWARGEPADGTLLAYYRREFRPALVAAGHGSNRRSEFDSAVNLFHDFCGACILVDAVTPERVAAFAEWLPARGVGKKTAYMYDKAIRRILRTARPELWPARGPRPVRCILNERKAERLPGRRRIEDLTGEPGTVAHFWATLYKQALARTTAQHRISVRTGIRLLRRFLGKDPLLSELTPALLAAFVAWLLEQGAHANTVKNHRNRLLSLWRYAHDEGYAPPPPARVRPIKVPRQSPDAWSLRELARLIAAAGRLDAPPIGGIPAADWWQAILLVGWYTGLRRRALLTLAPENIDPASRWINVPAGAMKNFVGQRFRIGQDAADALAKIIDPARERVFPIPEYALDQGKYVSDRFAEIITLAGVPKSELRNGQFHKLRRTTATHVAASAGLAAASALLGHSSADLLKRYIDPRFIVGNDATEFLPALDRRNH